MAYVPETNSVVAFQSRPSSLLAGVSVMGLTPVAPTPASVFVVNPVSTLSINTGNSSVQLLVGSAVIGSVAVLQGTDPWKVNVPTPSYIAYQAAGSVLAVSGSFSGGNSSVQLLVGSAVIGSVATLQGTNPWVISNPSVTAFQGGVWATSMVGGPINVNSILGTYLEKNATVASAFGVPFLFKNNMTTSTLSTVSTTDPLPVQGSVTVLQGTNPWQINMPSPSVVSITPAGSVTQVRTDNASVIAVLSNSSVAVLQGTDPWKVNVPTPSYIAYQAAGSIMAVSATVNTGNSSVQLLVGSAVIGSVATLQGTNPWVVSQSGQWNVNSGSIVGTYQEKAAAGIASALGQVMLFKNNPTTSTLSTVSWLDPLPASVSGTVRLSTGATSVQLMAGINNAGSITAIQGTTPWITTIQANSIVGTYAEDSAHATASNGLFVLQVRNDTMSSVTSADGDYSPIAGGPVGETIVANSPITKWVSGATSVMYGTSVQVISPPGTSIFTYITGINVINESATASRVTITQGLGRVPASMLTWLIAPAGGGSNNTFINPLRVLDNNGVSASISGVSSVFVTITGFNAKV